MWLQSMKYIMRITQKASLYDRVPFCKRWAGQFVCEDFGTAPPRHFSSHGLQLHPPLTSPRSVLCIYIHSCIYSSAFPFSRYCCHRHKSTRFSLRRMRLQSISQPLSSKHAQICTVHPMFLPNMFKKQDGMLAFVWYCASDCLTTNV